tara:strand:+ start:3621 stop:4205 length:585 start_codon:yes stop_codon:yes gene_type:complete
LNNLVIVGHPDKQSFCHNGIYKTIKTTFNDFETQKVKYIDLYDDKFHRNRNDLIDSYKEMALWADRIYFISPVWWFRLTPKMETFFDEVFTPGFAYEFVNITKTYAYPRSFFKKKKIRCYLTHGAPAIPVLTIYLNSVKLRLVLGVFTFVFGWGGNWSNTKQFWSVPFVSQKKREKYIESVRRDIIKDAKKIKK